MKKTHNLQPQHQTGVTEIDRCKEHSQCIRLLYAVKSVLAEHSLFLVKVQIDGMCCTAAVFGLLGCN